MTKTAPISVRLDPELNTQLTTIATALDRPKSWVIAQAVQEFVTVQQWQIAAIEEGLRAADAGQLVAHADVQDWVRSWDGPDETPMPGA